MAMYTGVFTAVAVTAQQDLFELVSATDSITIIHAVKLVNLTEIGDAQEEMLDVRWRSGNTTAGTGGAAVTPAPVETGSSAYGGTLAINRTTKASAGAPIVRDADAWNVRSQYLWIPTPEMRFILGPSVRICFELASTPVDSITMGGTIYFEEIGG